ncbi:hypothetical protein EGM70_15775 [Enterobacteriaceae bacterium 89]|nr:hypothetical protein [Enterobacteriaceae bacterium 89]
MKPLFFYAVIMVLSPFMATNAYSACYTNQGGASSKSYDIVPPNIIVQRDTAVGSVIYTTETARLDGILSCTAGGGYYGEMTLFTTPTSIPDVYQTNVPGVGVSVGTTWYFESPANFRPNAIAQAWNFPARTVNFVKTGPITSMKLSSGQLGRIYGDGDKVTALSYNLIGSQITQVACSITAPNLIFPIGDIPAASFGSSVGTTPSGAQNTQNLGLNCDAGANINISLQGTQNPDVSTTSVLALTGQGNTDVAKGVGVQLLYNGSPLVLNNRIVLKRSAGGQETFPITARYYQTKTAVTTGKANASATLDLTYQ